MKSNLWAVVLWDQGRTEEIELFETKQEAQMEIIRLKNDFENYPSHWYHLANPSWHVARHGEAYIALEESCRG